MPSPEKTRKSNEVPHQAVQRERRATRRRLSALSAGILSQVRVEMARELIDLGFYDGDSGEKIVKTIVSGSKLSGDIARV